MLSFLADSLLLRFPIEALFAGGGGISFIVGVVLISVVSCVGFLKERYQLVSGRLCVDQLNVKEYS